MNRERHRDKSTINVFACGIGLVWCDRGLLCLIYKRVIGNIGPQMLQEMLPKMDLLKQ